MTIPEMSHDITGHPFPALHPLVSIELAVQKTSPSTVIPYEGSSVVRLYANEDMYVSFDGTAATIMDMLLPKEHVEYFTIPNLGGVSFLAATKNGLAYSSLMS